ncbi:hypothetical protein [Methylobacterium radiotolerans]|uniref:hypothetical protein n=1 Tax=Methylobacterium radiotolerans TaxID=31998 RepID=UPI0015F48863|nr:hypothetical protein [Methylobacterium radiotolerans]
MNIQTAVRMVVAGACLAAGSPLIAAESGLGLEVGQFEINVTRGAEKLKGAFGLKSDGRQCGNGIRCNWDLDGGVVMWADTVDGSAVTSAGVGMNTDRRGYLATVSPKVFRNACAAILAAAAPDMPVARVQKDVASATDLFGKKRERDVREGRLIIYGERHEPSFKSKPDDAYYRCVVETRGE